MRPLPPWISLVKGLECRYQIFLWVNVCEYEDVIISLNVLYEIPKRWWNTGTIGLDMRDNGRLTQTKGFDSTCIHVYDSRFNRGCTMMSIIMYDTANKYKHHLEDPK